MGELFTLGRQWWTQGTYWDWLVTSKGVCRCKLYLKLSLFKSSFIWSSCSARTLAFASYNHSKLVCQYSVHSFAGGGDTVGWQGFKGRWSGRWQDWELGKGSRTDANAADEPSCSPSASVFTAGSLDPTSSAYLLAERPAPLVGVFGDGSGAAFICEVTVSARHLVSEWLNIPSPPQVQHL